MYKTKTNRRKEDYSTMNNYNTNQEEINQDAKEIRLTDVMRNSGSISVNKDLIRFMDEGRATGLMRATVLTEIISKYEMWKDKGDLQKDGSFFYTADEIENDTGVTEALQKKRVFPYLESLGLLKRESRRHPDNPMKQVRFIKLDVKACIKLFEEIIPKFKEKAEKARHDALGLINPSGKVYQTHPEGSNKPSSNTVLNNTKLNNTKYINQSSKEYNSNIDKQPRKKKEPNRLTEHDIQQIDFSTFIQVPLKHNLENINKSNNVTLKEIRMFCNQFKDELHDSVIGMILGNIFSKPRNYSNFIKYACRAVNNYHQEQEKQSDHQSSEVIPEWFEEQKRQREEAQRKKESSYETDYSKYDWTKQRNVDGWLDGIEPPKESSYETDYSKYDFSGKVLGNKSWLPDYDEEPKENQ